MADRLGEQLGSYRLLRQLGAGGFAEVYLGEHIYLKTLAAMKVLRAQLEQVDLERFLTEARTIASLVHPHIVRVLDFGVTEGTAFLVMDYAPHGSLRECYLPGVPLPPELTMLYVQQVADALEYAHATNRIHCDIKPENLLLGRQEEVWLSDFGIAVLAEAHSQQRPQNFVGTLAYAAPEQLQGQPVFASDQYALGIVVYEWLTGKVPFAGASRQIAAQQVMTPPQPLRERVPTISPAVEAVVLKALAKDPAARFASVADFAEAFTEASRSVTFFFSGWKPGLPSPEESDQESALLPAELATDDFSPGQEPPEAVSAEETIAEQTLATVAYLSAKSIEQPSASAPRVTSPPAAMRRRRIYAIGLAALIVLILLTALAYGAVGQGLASQKGRPVRLSAGASAVPTAQTPSLPTPGVTGTPSPSPTQTPTPPVSSGPLPRSTPAPTPTVAFVVKPASQVVYCHDGNVQAGETITLDNAGSTVAVAWRLSFPGFAWASASPASGRVAAGAQATLTLTLFDFICDQIGNQFLANITYQANGVSSQVLISTRSARDDR
ncbi:MAG TPA: serine/threonine-protein kinase [Ktedonobacterales bacterium]|nr:serine/threonine-protein kinase [Ktedonobacterales bacterium]